MNFSFMLPSIKFYLEAIPVLKHLNTNIQVTPAMLNKISKREKKEKKKNSDLLTKEMHYTVFFSSDLNQIKSDI